MHFIYLIALLIGLGPNHPAISPQLAYFNPIASVMDFKTGVLRTDPDDATDHLLLWIATSDNLSIRHKRKKLGTPQYWYVRPDGGTRYSSKVLTGQCNGQADVSYATALAANGGAGTNLNCAFNDVRSLYTDGTYASGAAGDAPSWGWIIAGGDIVTIRGSLGTGVSYRVGINNTGTTNTQIYSEGIAGNAYASGMPPPPNGTPGQPTKILGENYASCAAPGAKTQLHGGFGVNNVLNLSGTSYIDVECLDITDFSACGKQGQIHACNKTVGPAMDDYATNGIAFSNTSTNDTLNNIAIHGMAESGIVGPTGNGVVITNISLRGNPGAGWNADLGNGTTGVGSLLVQNFDFSWNGFAEEYPIVDALPYQDGTDQNDAGYGDAFGTATVASPPPGWQVHFDQGVVSYNTQDGLDALHLRGIGSSILITRTLAFGNMGQQIKIGGEAGNANNNVIWTNCNAMKEAIPGTPAGYNSRLTDFCRAFDGVVINVGAGMSSSFDYNLLVSGNQTAIDVECDTTNGACDATAKINLRNNVFVGVLNSAADGYDSPTNDYSNPIYNGLTAANLPDPFTNAGSQFSNNVTFHPKSTWTCPAAGEVNALCGVDPMLTDENWHLFGYGNATPLAGSPLINAGMPITDEPLDFNGTLRSVFATTIGPIEVTGTTPPPPVPTYTLTVNSSPTGVSFAVSNSNTAKKVATGTSEVSPFTLTGVSGSPEVVTAPNVLADGSLFNKWTGCTSATANICYETLLANASVTASYTAAPLKLVSIAITPVADGLTIGSTAQLSAVASYSDGQFHATNFVWTSSNPAVATVDANGLVTALTVGTTNITAATKSRSSNASVISVTSSTVVPSSVTVTLSDGSTYKGSLTKQ